MPTLEIASDQRAGVIGRTQMGKTFLVEHLLAQQPRVVVLDGKHRVTWKGFHLTYDAEASFLTDRVIYRHPRGGPPPGYFERMMEDLNERGGGVIYIDELPTIASASKIDDELADIFRLGAELNVGVVWAAQESTAVPNTAIRQSDVLILFRIHGASDRDKLIRIAGDIAEVTKNLQRYQFVVYTSNGVEYDPDAIPVYTLATDGTEGTRN